MSDIEHEIGEHEGRITALEAGQKQAQSDNRDVNSLIREIYADIKELKNRSACSSPNECIALREAMVDQNKRLTRLELKEAEVLGKKTIIVSIAIVVGWCVNAAIAWFHKG